MSTTSVQSYLFFGGSCEEALEFYQVALDAEVEMMMRFNQSPDPATECMIPSGYGDKVMHASFRVAGTSVLASDGCHEGATFAGFALAITLKTEEEVTRYFARLADGGSIGMPLAKTFWSPLFGSVTDRFGVTWMLMVDQEL